jgi:hypothetical protein
MPENISTENAVIKADVGNLVVDDPVLTKYAAEIRRLGKRVKEDVVAIGRYLDQAQKHAGRGAWLAWIQAEFGWSDQTAYNFIHLYGAQQSPEFQKFWNSDLPVSALYRLAAPNTPVEARQKIAQLIEAGEKPSVAEVTEVVARAKNGAADSEPVQTNNTEGDDVEDSGTAEHRAAMARLADAEDTPAAVEEETKTTSEEEILRDLVLEEFFAQASGADIFARLPAARLDEVIPAFLDKLTVEGMRTRMSDSFGLEARRKLAAPGKAKKSAKGCKKSINHRPANHAHQRDHRSRH